MFSIDFNGKPYIKADNASPLFFIAGPCAMESRAHALEVSAALKEIFAEAGIPFLYKSSFDKANRSSGAGFRGVGMKEGLSILAEVRESRNVPVLTDIHTAEQAAPVAEVVDYLQTPAFLCRQTDLILAAAATMKPVNIKKGQFLAPWEMENTPSKISYKEEISPLRAPEQRRTGTFSFFAKSAMTAGSFPQAVCVSEHPSPVISK